MSGRYGHDRVRRGLIHFLLGKVVSAVAGLLAMVLVVRGLTVPDFAAYSVLFALVEVFTAVSGLGLAHVMLRYVPELYALHRTHALRTLVARALSLRTFVLVLALLLAWAFAAPLARLVGLDDALPAFVLFLCVVGVRSSSYFLSQILESTLSQGTSQLAFSLSALARCTGMAWLSSHHGVTLMNVIMLELACDLLACVVLATGTLSVIVKASRDDGASNAADRAWWPTQRPQVVRFAAAAYLQHLATLPFGGNTNRLVGGAMFSDSVMASFGFAQSLYEYFKRYLPTQLLIGLIRPIVVARFADARDFSAASQLCDRVLQINLALLGGALVLLAVAGGDMLSALSGGKYGGDSALLLAAMLLLLGLESHRLILEVLAQTVERYELMIPSNLLLSSSVLLGMAAYGVFGAIAFPLANLAALACANAWVVRRLMLLGYRYRHAWRTSTDVVAGAAMAIGLGLVVRWLGAHWLPTAAVGGGVYGLWLLWTRWRHWINFYKELVGVSR